MFTWYIKTKNEPETRFLFIAFLLQVYYRK